MTSSRPQTILARQGRADTAADPTTPVIGAV